MTRELRGAHLMFQFTDEGKHGFSVEVVLHVAKKYTLTRNRPAPQRPADEGARGRVRMAWPGPVRLTLKAIWA